MTSSTPGRAGQAPSAVEAALAEAERNGFRLAVLGWAGAMLALAAFYSLTISGPNSIKVPAAAVALACISLASLAAVGRRGERAARFAFFAFNVLVVSGVLAVVPLSSSGDVPQNFVFFSSRHHYYYIVVAVSVLTLSPALVLWTGLCAVAGLAGATAWIADGMEHIVSYRDLPAAPSRDSYLAVVHDPNFLNIPARINEALVMVLATAIAALAVHRARNVVRAHAAVEEKRGRVQSLLGRYVPAQVANQLVDEGQLAPQQRHATILFADIEGFTQLSERLAASRVIGLLDRFFDATAKGIEAHGGIVVNHVGDALIAAFNAPLPVENHAERAVDAARALQSLVSGRDFDGHRLRLRIGIATGPVAAGTVGGATHQTYTVYGDTVNLAQRLERLNKELGTNCLICGTTFQALPSKDATATAVGSVHVTGREKAIDAFSIGPGAVANRARPTGATS